jgi:hypothetical protein
MSLYGQNIGTKEISETDLTLWRVDSISQYEGIYHFGEGDGSHLRLIYSDSVYTAQIKEGYWEDKTGIFKYKYTDLSNIKINEKGEFISDQHIGQFIFFESNSKKHKGLKIINPWTSWLEKDRYEVGIKMEETKK